jgi:hypothetical protein
MLSASVSCIADIYWYLRMLFASFSAFQASSLHLQNEEAGSIYKEIDTTRTELMNFFWLESW